MELEGIENKLEKSRLRTKKGGKEKGDAWGQKSGRYQPADMRNSEKKIYRKK